MKNASRLSLALGAGLSLTLAAGPALAVGPADLLYERALMSAADGRCGLFAPGVGSALAASAAQARGAALRAGQTPAQLDAVELRAKVKAAGTACASSELKTVAAKVSAAYQGYARQSREIYQGDTAQWIADRNALGWRLSQAGSLTGGRVTFGLTVPGALTAAASFNDGRAPYTARLVIRDVARTQGPYLNRQLAGANGKLPYAARIAPAAASRTFMASSRSVADAAVLPSGATSGWSFGFPAAAAQALARLDPREAVSIEFVFSSQGAESVRTAYVEVGDFAAGQAFLQIASR